MTGKIKGLLFDKDGTLLDFDATWGQWASRFFEDLAQGDPELLARLAGAVDFDIAAKKFNPTSPVIAGTADVAIDLLQPLVPHWEWQALMDYGNEKAAQAELATPCPLPQLFDRLDEMGLTLGVATNDAESSAQAHMRRLGVEGRFARILGFDSGFGGKPAPQMLWAFSEHCGFAPDEVAMIGDSTHDLHAGRNAGMVCVGVLTGPASRIELAPHADVVLDTIADIPDWLEAREAGL
ncbi:HAD family hydrolase [Litoreibacter janthinus]|uniref:phosphoglycolate phosphatase n=1 Tax=Litoreibacter janthinus TaxID=670154 RepID=A0A1I6GI33_9RHOB|nr:HAD family hydrolase [Litoreibacter janthinus]SFR41836.1 phosphoglycolate phosphatase [Litoreibacter janthinus]